jgi:hypothetical protein
VENEDLWIEPFDDPVWQNEDLWIEPFDDPVWQQAELMVGALPRPAKGYVTCSLAWLGRVRLQVHSAEQLVVLQLIYRRCLWVHSRTVSLPNSDLADAGFTRYGKYHALTALEKAGLIAREPWDGKATRVTLLDFP